jgi:hypothetical protein
MNNDQHLNLSTQTRLLSNLLDSLDDLYDRHERSEWVLKRLMAATGEALRGTEWEEILTACSDALTEMIRHVDMQEWNERALAITGELRLLLAGDDAIASGDAPR